MANVKITDLTALSGALVGADLFEMVDDVAGTPVSRKVTAEVARAYFVPAIINDLVISYSSTTAVAVSSGSISLNGTIRSYTGATYTSGSTMKNMANSTVTLGASKAYTVFAYNNAGTVEIRFEDRDGTGDGAACTWDATLEYWKAASTGAEARKIGVLYTNGSSQFYFFKYTGLGRDRQMMLVQGPALVSNGTATSFTSLTITPWIQSDDVASWLAVGGRRTTTAGMIQPLVAIDGGTSNSINVKGYADTALVSISFGNQFAANTGTIHYMLNGGGADSTININGLALFV